MAGPDVKEEPFPARSKQAVGTVGGIQAEVTAMSFKDKLLVTISQGGRLSQWVGSKSQAATGPVDPVKN